MNIDFRKSFHIPRHCSFLAMLYWSAVKPLLATKHYSKAHFHFLKVTSANINPLHVGCLYISLEFSPRKYFNCSNCNHIQIFEWLAAPKVNCYRHCYCYCPYFKGGTEQAPFSLFLLLLFPFFLTWTLIQGLLRVECFLRSFLQMPFCPHHHCW